PIARRRQQRARRQFRDVSRSCERTAISRCLLVASPAQARVEAVGYDPSSASGFAAARGVRARRRSNDDHSKNQLLGDALWPPAAPQRPGGKLKHSPGRSHLATGRVVGSCQPGESFAPELITLTICPFLVEGEYPRRTHDDGGGATARRVLDG